MSVTCRDILGCAADLGAGRLGETEVAYRAGVSRAYYAGLVCIVDRADQVQVYPEFHEPGVHGAVRRALKNAARTHFLEIREQLKAMEEDRTWADYETGQDGPQRDDVEFAVRRATELIGRVEGLSLSDIGRIRP